MNQTLNFLFRSEQLKLAKFLRNCSRNLLLDQGMQAHAAVVKMGFCFDMILSNDLVDMYGKCQRMDNACKVFDKMSQRNVVSWTALICGFLHEGDAEGALSFFYRMGLSDVKPNEYTFSACFKACGLLGMPERGMQVHSFCVKAGFECNPVVGNSVIDMYAKCGSLGRAAQAFNELPVKNRIAWNTIIAGYNSEDNFMKSIELLLEMLNEGESPDEFTFTSLLKACSNLRAIHCGTQIHAALITRGFPVLVQTALVGALIDMYVKCGCLIEGQKLFDHIEERSIVSWASLVLGYAQEGYLSEAMDVFEQLREGNIQVDAFTLSGLIGVFADFAFVVQGKQMHAYAAKLPSCLELEVANSIADLYLKCGLMEDAERFFGEMPIKNRVSYTVMITGYGKHGLGEKAVVLFNEMLSENIRPDSVTYLAILSACSHSGLIEECQEYFCHLCNDRWTQPRVEHYSCMVDLLGRAGRLNDAKNLIKSMPMKPNVGVWQTLLSACRVHGDLELGKVVGKTILELDPDSPVNYVLISNIFANGGYWKESQVLREAAKRKGLKKDAGQSWVEINKIVHFFYGGDDTHPLTSKIHHVLKEMERRLKEELGYTHEVRFALHDVDEESKEENLRVHSEKLAIGLALLSGGMGKSGKVIRIFKNLRVCGDCHEFIKGLSKILEKVILVRDANRFHKFQDGKGFVSEGRRGEKRETSFKMPLVGFNPTLDGGLSECHWCTLCGYGVLFMEKKKAPFNQVIVASDLAADVVTVGDLKFHLHKGFEKICAKFRYGMIITLAYIIAAARWLLNTLRSLMILVKEISYSRHRSWLNINGLLDVSLAEIASDPSLPLASFVELSNLMPKSARPVHDGLYTAMDISLKFSSWLFHFTCPIFTSWFIGYDALYDNFGCEFFIALMILRFLLEFFLKNCGDQTTCLIGLWPRDELARLIYARQASWSEAAYGLPLLEKNWTAVSSKTSGLDQGRKEANVQAAQNDPLPSDA
ncbi:hypothetical protein Cgig2_006684 [Carnegiea gigantea]|uniref:Pentatricopeptide repeat-containing protein n=1 Tax=Carnegiea gigantea TaxID=171969 RepID=A0A9Q1JSI6_9CARY|nr:hypothetical protein Cgig2_006684 [Carnegiea gigantea]